MSATRFFQNATIWLFMAISAGVILLSLSAEEKEPNHPALTTTGRSKYRGPDALYVPTPWDTVERMLELAEVRKEDLVYDLGSGDGRILIAAARKYGCRAIGYEIDQRLVQQSRERVRQEGLEHLVRIEHGDLFKADLSNADVVAVYLPGPLLERLLPQLDKLRPGARIVSHQFEIPNRPPAKVLYVNSEEDGERHRLMLWKAPLNAVER
jgi:SAM-dependent methyltransferase